MQGKKKQTSWKSEFSLLLLPFFFADLFGRVPSPGVGFGDELGATEELCSLIVEIHVRLHAR